MVLQPRGSVDCSWLKARLGGPDSQGVIVTDDHHSARPE